MKLEDQVVSLKLAKKLKELGVEQESVWFWMTRTKYPFLLVTGNDKNYQEDGYYSAYTVAELGEMLPEEVELNETTYWITFNRGLRQSWTVAYRKNGSSFTRYLQEDDAEADARAKMLIYLIENNLITT